MFQVKYIVTCRVVHVMIMTGSSSDDWILLALRLQPLLITRKHNTVAIPHTLVHRCRRTRILSFH
jgi:hypothetical protein